MEFKETRHLVPGGEIVTTPVANRKPSKPRGIVIILDGLGDRPSSELGGRTPLEAAHTPNLDRLVSNGQCGQIDTFIPGMPVGTHTGTSLFMGVAPREAYKLARGPIEASGVGLPVQSGDIVMRCNFATVKTDQDRLKVLDRRAGRIRKGTDELSAALNGMALGDGVVANVYPATQHRGVVCLSGPHLSQSISDTDPGELASPRYVLSSVAIDDEDAAASHTAKAVNEFVCRAYEILRKHPVNKKRIHNNEPPATGIITRGAGIFRETHTLLKHIDLKVAVVAGERTVLGLAKLFNYTPFSDPGFTSLPDTNLEAKVKAVESALKSNDLVFLHIKGTDTCSHDRDPQGKTAFIERIDTAIGPLLGADRVVGVAADHSTDSTLGRHCGDPVPGVIYAANGRVDACQSFGEASCMQGGLGRVSASTFLLTVLDLMNRLHEYRPSDSRYLLRV